MRPILPIALLAYFGLLMLLFGTIPLWLTLGAALGTLWKAWILRTGLYQPPRLLIFVSGLLFFLVAATESPRFLHRETATSLVVVLGLMMLIDRPHKRQIMLVHGHLFAMLVGFLVAPGPTYPLFLYFFLTSIIFISLLMHHLPSQAFLTLLPLGRNLLKIGLPVAAILLPIYFYFPEIRSNPSDLAISGISDVLEPGRIASLALSDRVAFRAKIIQKPNWLPPLYWRVAVLNESFGMVWRKRDETPEVSSPLLRKTAPLVYQVIGESRLRGLLPLVEHTVYARPVRDSESGLLRHPQLQTFRSPDSLIEAGSTLGESFQPEMTPTAPEPLIHTSRRVQDLVNDLRRLPVEGQILSLLHRFQSFRYSLKPGTLDSEDKLDEFLFVKKLGFCEHFAASFASLLQMAGTPARVVTGFQGGTSLGSSGFILVLDSDAHAWTEVWMGDRWQRVDPSFVVPGAQRRQEDPGLAALISAWLGYWARIGGARLNDFIEDIEIIWLVLLGTAGGLLSLQIIRVYRRRQRYSPWAGELRQFLTELRDQGYVLQDIEPHAAFFRRLATEIPNLRPELERLAHCYNAHVYGPPESAPSAADLKELLRQARLKWKKLA
jgi:transglutaminase-like putative cysteine protease